MPHKQRQIILSDRSAVGEARRAAQTAAESLQLKEEQRSDVGIVATEVANNVILHAGSGEMLVCTEEGPAGAWLDLLTLDTGPGIRDVGEASRDGFSSRGTAGEGLGAISRQSDQSGLFSQADRGTVNWSRFYRDPAQAHADTFGVVNIPLQGEQECGDSYAVCRGGDRTVYMMVDGLGHGPQAAEAAREAVAVVEENQKQPASEIIARAHDALRKTRGAAMSVAIVHHEKGVVTYAGVGNISAFLQRGPESRSFVSQNGTLGAVLPRQLQDYQFPFQTGSLLTMFSDGLTSKVSYNSYAGLQNRHPQVIAGVLYRDFSRRRDDASVLVARLDSRID